MTDASVLPPGGRRRPPTAARRLVDALDHPAVLLALDGRFLHVNEPAARCLGTGRAELHARTLPELTDDPRRTDELLRSWAGSTGSRPSTLVFEGGPRSGERLRADGARIDEDLLVVRFHSDRDGDRFSLLSREIEASTLRELQARLRSTLRELEDANRQLATRNAELERYAAAVAHDLRTPVYIVRGYVELLASGRVGEVDDAGHQLLGEILQGADRLSAVIDGLLSVAKLQVERPDAPADSSTAVQVVLDELRDEVARAEARVVVGPMEPAWSDPTHLVQVLVNLVGNSLKFRRPGPAPTIWITSRRRPDHTEFVVEDDGLGVPEPDRERIFDLFDRGGSVPDEPGTGIGLATCRKIVESYGGSIRCEASDSGGARFVFTIADRTSATVGSGRGN